MAGPGHKADLQHHLQLARDAVLWKLDALPEDDQRRVISRRTPAWAATNLEASA